MSELETLKATMERTRNYGVFAGDIPQLSAPSADAVIAHLEAELARVAIEARCPCCRAGVSITGEICQECHGNALVGIAYETTRFQYKQLQERERKLREACGRVILAWKNPCGWWHEMGDAVRAITAALKEPEVKL
jgi:hypothetical protein